MIAFKYDIVPNYLYISITVIIPCYDDCELLLSS